jgi:hypothetical protein
VLQSLDKRIQNTPNGDKDRNGDWGRLGNEEEERDLWLLLGALSFYF